MTRLARLAGAWSLVLVATSGAPSAGVTGAAVRRVDLGDGLVAAIDARGPHLAAEPLPREGLLAFSERLCGDRERSNAIAVENDGDTRLLRGVRYRVPFDCLTLELQSRVLRGLFPGDEATPEGWRHVVAAGPDGELPDLWRLAEWFTGDGERWRELRALNRLRDEELAPGTPLLVPAALLRPAFRSPVALLAARASPVELEYGNDERGPYAAYRLRAGEAIYSSVVIRLTGRLFAADVYPLAEEIAERSGIRDVTDIPIGFRIKVPLDYLSPEYLPPEHPRRVEYEAGLAETARYMNRVQALGLEGVVVVLDSGHGGRDVGAAASGVWESIYVYDVMLRVKRILEASTGAIVLTTTRDGEGYEIFDRDELPHSHGHRVLTEPPYPIEIAQVGTHLRWYLANFLLAQRVKEAAEADRVVFLSIHADSLHPSVRGAMVYVPGLLPLPSSYGKSEPVYTSRREVRARPTVTFTKDELTRNEGLSRDLAGHLIAGFRGGGLAVHPNNPVRDRIVRGRGSPWVPAVLRYNTIPAKVLLEVCNLANEQDRRLIQTRDFRERVARAVVDGLLSYYGFEAAPPPEMAAASSRE